MANPPNFAQAVDLSSLAKPKTAPAAPLPGLEVTAANLSEKFLPLSATRPVIVIIWSSRSPESIELVKTLGSLEVLYKGSWVLGHIDAEAQPQVAQAFQTKSVPYAVALVGEQLVPLFEKTYPEDQIRLVIDKILSLAAGQGIGSQPVEISEPEEDEAITALEAGNFKVAEAAYKRLLLRKPTDSFAKLGLAQTQLLIRSDGLDLAKAVQAATDSPADLVKQIEAADLEMVNGKIEQAFNRLLNVVRNSNGEERSRAKEHLLLLFALIDPSDPRLVLARSALANALF